MGRLRTDLGAMCDLGALGAVVLGVWGVGVWGAGRASAQQCPPGWVTGESVAGVDGPVFAAVVHDDGSGPSLFAGGDFDVAGGVRARGIARWDGAQWHAVGKATDLPEHFTVQALAVSGGALYAGSYFGGPAAGTSIFRWDGSAWTALPTGMHTTVNSLASYRGDLIVGGRVITAQGRSVGAIARWDGVEWTAVGGAPVGGVNVRALRVYDGELYAGGVFYLPNPTRLATIARFDGSAWSVPGDGLSGQVNALAEYRGELIAAGTFERSGQTVVNCVAAWNGAQWSALGDGLGDGSDGYGAYSATVAVAGDELVVGGIFDLFGQPRFCDGLAAWSMARWDGSCWLTAGEEPFSTVLCVAEFDGKVFAGGYPFGGAGGCAIWDGLAWSLTVPGSDDAVCAATTFDGALVVGGEFGSIGGVGARHVAVRRDGVWQALGDGPEISVHALAVYRGRLVAGGGWMYQGMGGRMSGQTAGWDGTAWVPLMNGLEYGAAADALLVKGDELIGAGWFYFNIATTTSVARWDGERWHPMGDDFSVVTALADWNGDVISAGFFDGMGNRVARWNGSAWEAVGGPLPGLPTALAVWEGGLIAAGVGFIARWDGGAWAMYAGVVPGAKCVLHEHNGALYAASAGFRIDERPAGNIVRFDGAGWAPFAGGLNVNTTAGITSEVGALASDGSDLVFGGLFTRAGDTVCAYLARVAPFSPADLNLDGFLDGVDAGLFANAFEAAESGADLNQDGFVDGMDYDVFNNAFENGC